MSPSSSAAESGTATAQPGGPHDAEADEAVAQADRADVALHDPVGDGAAIPPPPEEPPAKPHLPALTVLAVMAVMAAAWAASEVLIPIFIAAFLAMLAYPVVRALKRIWIPSWLGAILVVVGTLAATVLLATVLIKPAGRWIHDAPAQFRQIAPKLRSLTQQVDAANRAAVTIAQAAGAAPAAGTKAVQVVQSPPPSAWSLVAAAPRTLLSILAVVLLWMFFLLYGERLQQRMIEVMPDRVRKHRMADILITIHTEVGRYVLTIAAINFVVAVLVATALFFLGLKPYDAMLWGSLAGALNFVPFAGPLTMAIILSLVGVLSFNDIAHILGAPAIFLCIHLLESQVVTPIVLGHRMALSPLVVLLWLLLWAWLWGVAGLLLAMPMLVAAKIICNRVDGLQGWAKVMEH
ncbi:MAG: AI-2E family transporter [Lysobacteraceae bacterium]